MNVSIIRTPENPLARWILFILFRIPVTLFFATLLYKLGQIGWILPYVGDGHYTEELTLKGWVVLMHSSLTAIVHRLVYTVLEPFGWRAWDAISFSSALAGGMALQVLFAIRSNPVFLAINILSGSFLVFAGEVESYAWVNLFLLLSFLSTEKYLNRTWPFWPSAVCLFTASLFHMLAIFYLPALFWVMRKNPPRRITEFLYPFLGFITLSIGILLLFHREGLDLDLTRLTPFFHITRKGQLFTFFTVAHWELLAYFHWKGCFLQCLPLEIPLLVCLRHRIQTQFMHFLFLCSIIGLIWTTLWHPDLGRLDWDLFSQMFIPVHVLTGILVSDWISGRIRGRTD